MGSTASQQPRNAMTNARLGELLRRKLPGLSGSNGHWEAEVMLDGDQKYRFFCMTDARRGVDRMRFVVPVAKITGQTAQSSFLTKLMSANFHSALDARYAIDRQYIWSIFLHPLSPLTDEQVESAISQVLNLAQNYGTSFASTDLVFVGGAGMHRGDKPLEPTHQWREDQLREQLQDALKMAKEQSQENQTLRTLLQQYKDERKEAHGSTCPGESSEGPVAKFLMCPITHELMHDPVIASDGHTYERTAIEEWLKSHSTSPMTNAELLHLDLVPNYLVRTQLIDLQEMSSKVQGART